MRFKYIQVLLFYTINILHFTNILYKIYLPQEPRTWIFLVTLVKFLDAGHIQGTLNKLREIFAALFLFFVFCPVPSWVYCRNKGATASDLAGVMSAPGSGSGRRRGRGSSCACALMRRLSAVKSERHTWQPTSKKAQLKPLPYCKAHIKMKSIKKFLVWIRPENSSDIWEQQKKGGSTAFKWFPQIIHENKAVFLGKEEKGCGKPRWRSCYAGVVETFRNSARNPFECLVDWN